MGIAAKVEDGNLARRAGDATSVAALRQLGLVTDPLPAPLADLASPPIVDPRGDPAGDVRPAFRLQ
jgi:L-asparaginase II